jgi:hypothetical protein
MDLVRISKELLLTVKNENFVEKHLKLLEDLSYSDLLTHLDTENKKKVFWINIYNAYYQVLRIKEMPKEKVYSSRQIGIAKLKWSLDDIEHGILRKYRYKYSLGYWSQLFVPKRIQKLAVDTVDYRIHFALNCGAKSCPPIAFYSEQKLNQQLNLAMDSFLESETVIDLKKNKIFVSKLFLWFLGDFGGFKGIKKIIEDRLYVETRGKKIKFLPYSWEDDLLNFV